MMRTLRDMNMSKLIAEDVPLFLALVDDLFPGIAADRTSAQDLISSLGKVFYFTLLLCSDSLFCSAFWLGTIHPC